MNYDLNTDNYSIDELFKLIQLNTNSNKEMVILNIENITKKVSKKDQEKVIPFMLNIKNKLLSYLDSIENIHKEPIITNNGHSKYETIRTDSDSKTSESPHFIIKNKTTPVYYSYDYKYPAGNVNPVERQLITKTLCFNTLFRSNYETTNANNVKWNLPYRIDNVISMRLSNIQIPIINYSISSLKKNNMFNIELFNMKDLPDTNIDIVIPDGNYSSSSMISTLNNIFTNIGNGLQYLFVDMNRQTAKIIIRAKNQNDQTTVTYYPYVSTSSHYSPNFRFNLNFGPYFNPGTNNDSNNESNQYNTHDNIVEYTNFCNSQRMIKKDKNWRKNAFGQENVICHVFKN